MSVRDLVFSHTDHVFLRGLYRVVYSIRTAEGQILAHALLDMAEKILKIRVKNHRSTLLIHLQNMKPLINVYSDFDFEGTRANSQICRF